MSTAVPRGWGKVIPKQFGSSFLPEVAFFSALRDGHSVHCVTGRQCSHCTINFQKRWLIKIISKDDSARERRERERKMTYVEVFRKLLPEENLELLLVVLVLKLGQGLGLGGGDEEGEEPRHHLEENE